MASTLTLFLDQRDWPEPPTLGVLAREGDHAALVAHVELHEPISVAGISAAVRTVTRLWLEPELTTDPYGALSDYLDTLGQRSL